MNSNFDWVRLDIWIYCTHKLTFKWSIFVKLYAEFDFISYLHFIFTFNIILHLFPDYYFHSPINFKQHYRKSLFYCACTLLFASEHSLIFYHPDECSICGFSGYFFNWILSWINMNILSIKTRTFYRIKLWKSNFKIYLEDFT